MKNKFLLKKQHGKTCTALLAFTAIGGVCALIAIHLQKQRQLLCAKEKHASAITCRTAARPISAGCQNVGQNETTLKKTNICANSSEWERGIS